MLVHLAGRLGGELVQFSDQEEVEVGAGHITSVWERLKEEEDSDNLLCHLHKVVAGDLHRLSH